MKVKRILFSLLLTLITVVAKSQLPFQPTLYLVSVDPETGCDVITWLPCPTPPFFDEYRVGMVELLDPNQPPVLVEAGFGINPADTTYINCNTYSNQRPVGYSVWAYETSGSGTASGFDSPDSTIYMTADFDTCAGTISLAWNHYNKWRSSTSEFNIYNRTAANNYSLIAQVSGTTLTYVMNNVVANQTYQLFVEAVNSDGIRRSRSNRVDIFTSMSQQPNNVNADFASISAGNSIDLSFTILGTPFETTYNLTRSNDPAGPFEIRATFNTSDNHVYYTDNVPFTSGIYYYRLEGINHCGQASSLSNLANNIILNGTLSGTNISVSWNEYLDWSGGVERYRVIRTRGRENPVTDTMDLGPATTFFIDDISAMANYADPVSSLVCYQVDAIENMNMLGLQGRSLSNRLCFSLNPDIRMPNAFIPNDGDATNQVFEPVFSFEPEQYEMTIYNRLGTKVWEGSGPWDGRANGKYVPEGVYLYYIRIYNYSTDYSELKGSVTVVYR